MSHASIYRLLQVQLYNNIQSSHPISIISTWDSFLGHPYIDPTKARTYRIRPEILPVRSDGRGRGTR